MAKDASYPTNTAAVFFPFVLAASIATGDPGTASPAPSPAPVRASSGTQLFTPPAGWAPIPRPAPLAADVQYEGYRNDVTGGERIVAFGHPSDGSDLNAHVERFNKLAAERATMDSKQSISLCGGIPGVEETFSGTNGNGFIIIYAMSEHRLYYATFSYPGYPGPSAEGKRAVESFCPTTSGAALAAKPAIDPPAGWTLVHSAVEFGRWSWHPAKSDGTIGVSVFVEGLRPDASLTDAMGVVSKAYFYNDDVVRRKNVTACGKYDAVRLTLRKRSYPQEDVEAMVTLDGRIAFATTYWRPLGSKPDPKAIAAIESLCPKMAEASQ